MKCLILRALAAAVIGLVSLTGHAWSLPEGPDPNCFVFVDLNGVETEFFGNRVVCETGDDGVQTLRASAQMEGYTVDLSFPLASIAQIKNEYRDMSGIVAPIVPTEGVDLAFGAGTIRVSGAKAGSQLRVYGTQGTLVATHRLEAESCAYSVASLPAGVYVVELNGVTLKIAKK